MATIQQPSIQQPAVAEAAGDCIVLHGISWELYEQLRDIPDNWGKQMTYDRGRLEIMSPGVGHEHAKKALARMLEAFTEELNVRIRSLGETTWKDPGQKYGLEADECYYIENESRVRDLLEEIDPTRDPPPDVAIEVERSRSVIGKLPLYAELGIPEVWRCDGRVVRVLLLSADGKYAESTCSRNLPALPISELNRFLKERAATDETTWIRSFRAWVRETFSTGAP